MSEAHAKSSAPPSAGGAEELDARVDAMLKEMDATTDRISQKLGAVLDPPNAEDASIPSDGLISDDSSPDSIAPEAPELDALLAEVAADLAQQTSLIEEAVPPVAPQLAQPEPSGAVTDPTDVHPATSPQDSPAPAAEDAGDTLGQVAADRAAAEALPEPPTAEIATAPIEPSPVESVPSDPTPIAEIPAADPNQLLDAVNTELASGTGLDAELAAAAEQLVADIAQEPAPSPTSAPEAASVPVAPAATATPTPEPAVAEAPEAHNASVPAAASAEAPEPAAAAPVVDPPVEHSPPAHPEPASGSDAPIEQLDQVLAQEAETVLAQSAKQAKDGSKTSAQPAEPPAAAAAEPAKPTVAPAPAPTEVKPTAASPTPSPARHEPEPAKPEKPKGPSLKQRAGALAQKALMPLARKTESLSTGARQTLGWIAVVTLLQSAAVWGYPLVRGPGKSPEPTSDPTVFLKPGDKAPEHKPKAAHGEAENGHGAPKADAHGAKKDDGHGAKKDDGHGAKKDDGHGAKKDDGHGAKKKDDGHGTAAKKKDTKKKDTKKKDAGAHH